MAILIEAVEIEKSFREVQAVKGVSFQVAAGEIYGLVGPDGAGKTTTLRALCGSLRLSGGAASIAGLDVSRHTELARSQIGYLPQRFSLYEELTVLENIRFYAEVRGLPAEEWRPRCMQILEFVGLVAFVDRRAGLLSGGMKQKLGLAAALVHRPPVLLLDEPTTGVDPVMRQDFWQLIIRLVSSGVEDGRGKGRAAVLVSTPYMDEAERCTRLGFMQRGSLVLEGTPAELRQRLEDRVLELQGWPLRLLRKVAEAQPSVQDVRIFGDRLHLRVEQGTAPAVMESLEVTVRTMGGGISSLRTITPRLEDVFMAVLGKGAEMDR